MEKRSIDPNNPEAGFIVPEKFRPITPEKNWDDGIDEAPEAGDVIGGGNVFDGMERADIDPTPTSGFLDNERPFAYTPSEGEQPASPVVGEVEHTPDTPDSVATQEVNPHELTLGSDGVLRPLSEQPTDAQPVGAESYKWQEVEAQPSRQGSVRRAMGNLAFAATRRWRNLGNPAKR